MTFSGRNGIDSAFSDYTRQEYNLYDPNVFEILLCEDNRLVFKKGTLDAETDSILYDTLFVRTRKIVPATYEYQLTYQCTFRSGLKHGYEYSYYRLEELRGVCLEDNYMLNQKAKWKWGKEHGKWIGYDKTGRIISVKTYRNGKLLKVKTIH